MNGLNKVQLIGRLGKDPVVKKLEGGNTVASFSLATSESYTAKDGKKIEKTEWHNIVAWGKLAEIIERYVRKGQLLYVCGKNRTRNWQKEGQTHYTTEVFIDEMLMLGSNANSGANGSTGSNGNPMNSNYSKPEASSAYEEAVPLAEGFDEVPDDDGADDLPF